MFDRFKIAKPNEVEEHVKNMISAWAAVKHLLEETQICEPDRKLNILTDFEPSDIFKTTEELSEHVAFHGAMREFQADITRVMAQITEEYQMTITVKGLKISREWLDKNLSYMTRSRSKQVKLSETLRSKLKPLDHE